MTKKEKNIINNSKKKITKAITVIFIIAIIFEFINGFFIGKLYSQFPYVENDTDILIIIVGLFIIPAVSFIAAAIFIVSDYLPISKKK